LACLTDALWKADGAGLPASAGALLCFPHEAISPVGVDNAARLGVGVNEGDGPLMMIVVFMAIWRSGLRGIAAKWLCRFDGELLKVSSLAAARGMPTAQELFNVQMRPTHPCLLRL
jgi:hypothetical protein